MSDRRRQRDSNIDCIELVENATCLPTHMKHSQDNMKLNELKNSLKSKHVTHEMIIRANISVEKKTELICTMAELTDI